MSLMNNCKVSFIIVARNASSSIGKLFEDIRNQTYEHNRIEIILIDSKSEDNTKELMQKFHGHFNRIVAIDNLRKNLPCGWNIALKESKGDIIVRVDAHASIPNDFIENIVANFEKKEMIVGGPRPSVIQEQSPWQKTLLFAETALFGSGIAIYRRAEKEQYVNSVAHGAYSRKVFETVGGYDERLIRTEDNDMHYRMRKAGFKILFDPKVKSYHNVRNDFSKMVKQKYSNGFWIGMTMGIQPKCFEAYHFVPLFFVLAILATAILAIVGYPLFLISLAILYCAANIFMTLLSMPGKGFEIPYLILPILFLILHLAYGIGTVIGLIRMPFYKMKNRECKAIIEVRDEMRKKDLNWEEEKR